MALYFIVTLGYGFYSYNTNKAETLNNIDEKLLLVASGIKRSLPSDLPDRPLTKDALSAIDNSNNTLALSSYAVAMDVLSVYTLVQDKGKICYTSSSKTSKELENDILIPYLTEYDNPSPKMVSAFDSTVPVYISESDKWHTIRRILVPETSPAGRHYLAGVDIDTLQIDKKLQKHLWTSVAISALFIFLAVPFIFLFRKTEKEHIEEFRSLKDMLFQRTMDRTTKIGRKIDEYIDKKK